VQESFTFEWEPAGEAERWLPVVGWEGLYAVSSLGRVRSFHAGRGSGKRGGLLKPQVGTSGHLTLRLSRNSAGKTVQIHQLVMRAFVGPCPAGMEVCHGPNGALDNRLSNLSYGTRSKNHGADRVRDGKSNRGERQWMAKLTEAQVIDIRRRYAAGALQRSLASEYGVTRSTIGSAIAGGHWAHVADGVNPPRPRRDPRAERNRNVKLTTADVVEIRRRYAAGGETLMTLGREYGVHFSTISDAIKPRKRRD
jgi:hypothetical protein